MLDVGIIGVDQEWERYRPALSKLRRPLRVQAVYDPVRARAERAAERLQAHVVTGLQALAKRSDVQAILLFNADWMSHELLQLLLAQNKPVFVNPWFFATPETYRALYDQAAETGLPVMPTMWRRFAPATMRLRELIATELGPPQSIRCDTTWNESRSACTECEELVGWLDYCRMLFRVYPTSLTQQSENNETLRIVTSFGTGNDTRQAILTIRLPRDVAVAEATSTDGPTSRIARVSNQIRNWSLNETNPHIISTPNDLAEIHIACENGSATVLSRTKLAWQSGTNVESPNESSSDVHTESLTSERPEHEVMLDLFCRRVVGGLIPVADFNDIYQASRLLQNAFEV